MFEFINSYLESETSAIIIADIIAATLIGLVGFIFRNTLFRYIRKLLPQLHSKTPHINFDLKEPKKRKRTWKQDIVINNAGNEPAYNVYVFFYERDMVTQNNYEIRSLGHEGVKRGVLGIRDRITFEGLSEYFQSCGVTSKHEIWIEFENSAGVAFRTVILPVTPKGTSEHVRPPKVIKNRLERAPSLTIEENDKNWKKYEKGKNAPFTVPTGFSKMKSLFIHKMKNFLSNMKNKFNQF